MSDPTTSDAAEPGKAPGPPSNLTTVSIHRVCTQCNNMFRVPAEKFDAKQCPNCHKG